MLAPVLARLDKVAGALESRVDWEGRHVLIRLAPGAGVKDVVGRAAEILGEGAVRLGPAAEADRIASFRRGDSWMRAGETIRQSRHEAGVLGARFAKGSAERAKLGDAQMKRLETLLTEEIMAQFERMHATGRSPGDVTPEELQALEARLRARCLEFTTAAQVDAIIDEIRSALGMCD
jgi:hypothetical protein